MDSTADLDINNQPSNRSNLTMSLELDQTSTNRSRDKWLKRQSTFGEQFHRGAVNAIQHASRGNVSSLCKIVWGIGIVLSILVSPLVFIFRLEPLELVSETRRFTLAAQNTTGNITTRTFDLPVICPARLGSDSYRYKFVPGNVTNGSTLHNEMQKCYNNGVPLQCSATLSVKDPNQISSEETNPYLKWIGLEDPRIKADAQEFWIWQGILVISGTAILIFIAYFTWVVEKCCCGNRYLVMTGKWFLQISSLFVIPALFALPNGGGQGRSLSEITAFLACIVWFFFLATVMIGYHDYKLLKCELGKNPVTLQFFIVIFVFLVACIVSFAYFLYFVTINYRFSFAFTDLSDDYSLCECGCIYNVPWGTYAACMAVGLTALANLVPLLDRTKDAMIHFDQFLSITHVVPGYLAKSVNLKNPTGLRDKWARNKLQLLTNTTRREEDNYNQVVWSPVAMVKPPARYTESALVKELILWFYYFCQVQAACIGILQVSSMIDSILHDEVTKNSVSFYVNLGYALTAILMYFAFWMLVEICVHPVPEENVLIKDKTLRVFCHICFCRSCLWCGRMRPKRYHDSDDESEEESLELARLTPSALSQTDQTVFDTIVINRPPSPVGPPPESDRRPGADNLQR